MRDDVSLVHSHPVCGNLLQQPRETWAHALAWSLVLARSPPPCTCNTYHIPQLPTPTSFCLTACCWRGHAQRMGRGPLPPFFIPGSQPLWRKLPAQEEVGDCHLCLNPEGRFVAVNKNSSEPVQKAARQHPPRVDSPQALLCRPHIQRWALGFSPPSTARWPQFPSRRLPSGWGGRKENTRHSLAGAAPPPSSPSSPSAFFPSSTSLARPGSRKQVFGEGILLGEERQAWSLVLQTQKPELALPCLLGSMTT